MTEERPSELSANRINFNRFTAGDSSEGRSREWALASAVSVQPRWSLIYTSLRNSRCHSGATAMSVSVTFGPIQSTSMWDAEVCRIRVKM